MNDTYQCGPSGREELQRVRGDCCPGGGSVLDVFSLASLQHPYLKVSPPTHFLSLVWASRGRSPLKRSS